MTPGFREQRKGEEFSSRTRTPQLQQETQLANLSPSSITGYNFQPSGLVRDVGAGNQLARTDQHGHFVELPPPVYSF